MATLSLNMNMSLSELVQLLKTMPLYWNLSAGKGRAKSAGPGTPTSEARLNTEALRDEYNIYNKGGESRKERQGVGSGVGRAQGRNPACGASTSRAVFVAPTRARLSGGEETVLRSLALEGAASDKVAAKIEVEAAKTKASIEEALEELDRARKLAFQAVAPAWPGGLAAEAKSAMATILAAAPPEALVVDAAEEASAEEEVAEAAVSKAAVVEVS
jgi:hypothetical protein